MSELMQIPAADLQRFQQSMQRISAKDGFYERFYERLFGESKEIGVFFRNRDIPSIIAKLRVTLGMVTEAAEGKPGLTMYLEMLGGIHRRLEVEPRFFSLWRKALIETLSEHDAHFNDEIRGSWERVIDQVIECMDQTENKKQRP